jgi:hypothetical protein
MSRLITSAATVVAACLMALMGGAGGAAADSGASGTVQGSPGVLTGNIVQAPVDISVNACGNSVDLGGVVDSTKSNTCTSG